MYFPPVHLSDIVIVGAFLLVSLGVVYLRFGRYIKARDTHTNYTTNKTALFLKLSSLVLSISILGTLLLRPMGLMYNGVPEEKGIDCIWLLDTSASMDVRDVKSGENFVSRLQGAKSIIENYMVAHGENRYGLVIFSGKARLVSPLTSDRDSLLSFLASIDSKSIHDGGTDFREALEIATTRSGTGSDIPQTMVLLSDGGDPEDAPERAQIRQFFEGKQTTLITVGMGQTKPSPIPIGNSPLGDTVYKKFQGEIVLSGLGRSTLKMLADIGKGSYIENATPIKELEKVLSTTPRSALSGPSGNDENDITVRVLVGLSLFLLLVFLLFPSSFLVRGNAS